MELYRHLLRPLLFRFDPERVHSLAMKALAGAQRHPSVLRALRRIAPVPALPTRIMGLPARNPVGLAAGLDKHGQAPSAFAALGCGWVELGTVTPRPQPGNSRPRLFRLAEHDALINRMGFNSVGLHAFLAGWCEPPGGIPVGINIGKNATTPVEQAVADYVTALEMAYAIAAYVTVNVSSPNTRGLRGLQEGGNLRALLDALLVKRAQLAGQHGKTVPIALKIAPDLNAEQLGAIADCVLEYPIDAVIATNTTTARPGVAHHALAGQSGGLSGAPLEPLSNAIIRELSHTIGGRIPIIGVGGICSPDSAWRKIEAGADAVQLYTGLIYHGPRLIGDIVRRFESEMHARDAADFAALVAAVHQQDTASHHDPAPYHEP